MDRSQTFDPSGSIIKPPNSENDSSSRPSSPSYTRRLVRREYPDPKDRTEDFDYIEWLQGVYGPGVIVVDIYNVPTGWVRIDGSPPI